MLTMPFNLLGRLSIQNQSNRVLLLPQALIIGAILGRFSARSALAQIPNLACDVITRAQFVAEALTFGIDE